MKRQSLKEYQLIREEMEGVKNCMTNYVGYVFGGSGVALFGLTSFGVNGSGYIGIGYASLMLSLLVSLVMLIIFYKFHSHNRYAGYCKLLTHETFEGPSGNTGPLFAWEICLERLRQSEVQPEILHRMVKSMRCVEPKADGLQWVLKHYAGDPSNAKNKKPPADRKRFWRGLGRLILALFGQSKSNSWGFPPFVAAVFFVLCMGFLLVGLYSVYRVIWTLQPIPPERGVLAALAITVTAAETSLWVLFCRRLHSLMTGSATVEAFFWRFLPIRVTFLNSQNIDPTYLSTQERIEELRSNAPLQDKAGPSI